MEDRYDVLIVGGSHAGLSAAMALGRLGRTALIVDSGRPRNEVSKHANNIAGMDGQNPSEIRFEARRDLKKYNTIEYVENLVVEIQKKDHFFRATLKTGEAVIIRKVFLAYGVRDKLLDIDGVHELWGKSIFHCPFCHGHEFRGEKIGLIGNADYIEHMVPMMLNLTSKLVLFPQEKLELESGLEKKLDELGIRLYDSKIQNLEREGDALSGVNLEDGTNITLTAILSSPILPFELSSSLADVLGCKRNDDGFIDVDPIGKTSVDGVFAAGDITTRFQSVVQAMASGQKAGACAVMELSQEDF